METKCNPMRNLYLFLTIIGFIAPNIFVFIESTQNLNILLWTNPTATMNAMFANNISTAFVVDLLLTVLVFFIAVHNEAKKYHMRNTWIIYILTLLFGMAGSLPLFLYLRERKRAEL